MSDPKQHPIWLLCNRLDDSLLAIREVPDRDEADAIARAATWTTAEIRGWVAAFVAQSAVPNSRECSGWLAAEEQCPCPNHAIKPRVPAPRPEQET